ncbi:MAG: ATP-binding protein [Anaerolineales bacterium]
MIDGSIPYFLLSPTAMAYLPVLLLHLVSLGYLLLHGLKSRQTWLFSGWLGGMTLMVMTQFAARVVYAPRVSGYVDWWGGVGGVTLAMIALLQFAYHFPRPRYPREARLVLILSVVVTGAIWAWMAWETVMAGPHYTSVTGAPDIALASTSVWEVYDFERFVFGFVAPRDAGPWVSFKLFDLWQVIGNLWVLLIWVRKTIQFSSPRQDFSPTRHALYALAHPQGREARLSRAWVLLMILAPLTVVISAIDAAGRLPPGAFATVHLLVLFAITMTYVHYAPEPTSLMVKLVGISLVTLLVILGIVSSYGLQMRQRSFAQLHQAEVAHVQTLVAMSDLPQLPAEVRYVAARPVAGLYADAYQMLAARPGAADAAHLAAHDALLRAGLLRDHFPARIAAHHESPWLGWDGAAALPGNAEAIQQAAIPQDTPSYRSAAHPDDYILRYSFVEGATRYEVGYSYAAYRVALHRAALPLAALLVGSTLFIVIVFPYFFHVGLVAPLVQLLAGVERVDRGELRGDIPVLIDDEIGRLTQGFNQMVKSLRTSEEELRALNVTLEQRVVDRTRDLGTLYEVATLVGQSLPLDELLAAVLARVVVGVDATAGLVLVTDDADGRLRPLAAHAIAPTLRSWVSSLPVLDAVHSQAETLLIHDLASDPRVAALFASGVESDAPFPYRSLVSLPISNGESILGVLIIFGAQPFLFNVEDLAVLASVTEQLSIAIENVRLREHAEAAVVWEERQRLARDLHDSVTQILYSQVLFANAARKFLDVQHIERVSYYLGRLGESATMALREMRLMIYRLRPSRLAEAGLIGALQRRLEMVEQRAGIRAHLTHEAELNLPDEIERALYHIAEEALNNALKHAAAAEVVVTVRYPPEQVCLSVRDDGCGFDAACVSEGLGLQSLHERAAALAGKLTVASAPGEGARIEICFPLPPHGEFGISNSE